MQTRTPTKTRFRSSRLRRLSLMGPLPACAARSRHALSLVEGELVARPVVAREVVVQELRALRGRELRGREPAHVALAVEADAGAEVPRHALVDDELALVVDTDEVRTRDAPQRAREHGDDDEQSEKDDDDPTAPAEVR